MTETALATIETVKTELATIQVVQIADLFKPEVINPMLDKIETHVRSIPTDISTDKGRQEIKSRAYKASLCKGRLDEMGKKLNEDAQKHIKAVNTYRNRAEAFLDALRDEIRQPVTEWEQAEKKRVADHEAKLLEVSALTTFYQSPPSSDEVLDRMAQLGMFDHLKMEEFCFRAENIKKEVNTTLNAMLLSAQSRERDAEELAKLRFAQAARDAEDAARKLAEREAQIAADAAEKARKDAEAAAELAAKAAADKAASELAAQKAAEQKARDEAAAAEERAKKAEADALAAAARAEAARLAAIEQARVDQEAAVEAERKRAADAKAAEDAATAAREANTAHRKKINNEALQALAALDCVLGDVPAKAIVIAIAEGRIPHVRIEY